MLAIGGEQLFGQLLDRWHLTDERVREQRFVDEVSVAFDRCAGRESLVRGDVLG